jgi:hypothetical protein
MQSDLTSSLRPPREGAHGLQAVLWLAAGAAWAIVAAKAWSESKKGEARRRTHLVSDRLLHDVFPHGIRS